MVKKVSRKLAVFLVVLMFSSTVSPYLANAKFMGDVNVVTPETDSGTGDAPEVDAGTGDAPSSGGDTSEETQQIVNNNYYDYSQTIHECDHTVVNTSIQAIEAFASGWDGTFEDWNTMFGEWDGTYDDWNKKFGEWGKYFETWDGSFEEWSKNFEKWDGRLETWEKLFGSWDEENENQVTWNQMFMELYEFYKGSVPTVGTLYSVNRRLTDCYYKPTLDEVKSVFNLPAEISYKGQYAALYTEYFDVNRGADIENRDPYKPVDARCRALEVLGYDLLLQSETYDFDGNKYIATRYTDDECSFEYIVMCLYKALGKDILSYDYVTKYNADVTLNNSPVQQLVSGFASDINAYDIKVFVTRTNTDAYFDRAVADLKLDRVIKSAASSVDEGERIIRSTTLTGGEFIRLVAELMDRYGEPVLNQNEMNQLMQIYGGNIPSYLSDAEREAYIYLKARGCLNDDTLNYWEKITPSQMFEILMCVADPSSRSDYKEIQPVLILNEELIADGFYPKTVTLSTGDNAFSVDVVYDECNYYDYFIEKVDSTTFKDDDGHEVANLFIVKTSETPASGPLEGTKYEGVVTIGGKEYYHFRALKDLNRKVLQINSYLNSDEPHYLNVDAGGGIYTAGNKVTNPSGAHVRTVLTREEFPDSNLWKDYVCEERCTEKVASESKNFLAKLVDFLFPVVKADAALSSLYMTVNHKKATLLDTGWGGELLNGANSTEKTVQIDPTDIKVLKAVLSADENPTTVQTVKQTATAEQKAAAKELNEAWDARQEEIKKQEAQKEAEVNTDSIMYNAIASIHGNVMIDLNDFMAVGTIVKCDDTQIANDILILYSDMNVIKLNNKTNEIIVGNTLYKLPKVKIPYLFRWDNSLKGEYKYWIDFRAVYGWSANDFDISVSIGTGESYTISCKPRSATDKQTPRIGDYDCYLTDDQYTGSRPITEKVYCLKKGASNNNKCLQMLTSTVYPQANWMMLNIIDKTGAELNYCVVYYSKAIYDRHILTGQTKAAPDDAGKVKELLGYEILPRNAEGESDWYCKLIQLERKESSTEGEFSYVKDYGFVYNIPNKTIKSAEFYDGTYILPLYLTGTSNRILNCNCSYWAGQGSIVAAPAGVAMLFGGGTIGYLNVSSDLVSMFQYKEVTNSAILYYGTSLVSSMTSDSDGNVFANVFKQEQGVSTGNATKQVKLSDVQKIYHVYDRYYYADKAKTDLRVQGIYIILDSALAVSVTEEQEEILYVEFEDADSTSRWDKFKDISLAEAIYAIDTGTSFIIWFTFTLVPVIGITLLTVLVGISMMADNKMLQKFFEKVFDPVYILTFGHLRAGQLTVMQSLISLVCGYIAFALLYNGNILRIIEWGAEVFMTIVHMLRGA